MKLRTVLPTTLAIGAAALSVSTVGAVAQDDPERPAPQERSGEPGRMMSDAEMRSMDRHHEQMVREMRDIDPEMARMMDRHHKEMMGQMHEGEMRDMGRMDRG
jgi:hypothetical protein